MFQILVRHELCSLHSGSLLYYYFKICNERLFSLMRIHKAIIVVSFVVPQNLLVYIYLHIISNRRRSFVFDFRIIDATEECNNCSLL